MLDQEQIRQIDHEVWMKGEQQLAYPDPAHLVPWEELNGWEKEVERKIGECLAQSALSGIG